MAVVTVPHTTCCPHPRISTWYRRGSSHKQNTARLSALARTLLNDMSSRAIEALRQRLCHARQQGTSSWLPTPSSSVAFVKMGGYKVYHRA